MFIDWTISDSVMGYYLGYSEKNGLILDGIYDDRKTIHIYLASTASVTKIHNLGEEGEDMRNDLRSGKILEGTLILAYGPIVPKHDTPNEFTHYAHSVIIVGTIDDNEILTTTWWCNQIKKLAEFYHTAQFGTGPIDYTEYHTYLDRGGNKKPGKYIQETDTISRLVYGMASAYMLTGKEEYLEIATQGSKYLNDNMRRRGPEDSVSWWIFGLDRDPSYSDEPKPLCPSECYDDYAQIAAYEQIYALAGLTQTYRVTGDPTLLTAIEETIALFENYYKDPVYGGYFSHLDPETFSPYSDSLGPNRAKKNWNSNGDHAPAYLFNLYLITGEQRYLDMLEYTFTMITEHFPSSMHNRAKQSPFVYERFDREWEPDTTWKWQQDRAVVGHNLKIAWNLTRMSALSNNKKYLALASRIISTIPLYGLDIRRGGWYDVLERQEHVDNEFVWHDHKAWWQQEQAILAFLILTATTDPAYKNGAFEAAAFYNTNFLDHDYGGIFFTTLATGVPYLFGDEGGKGSHSMSMYHTSELCFLSAVYIAYLLKESLTLWFKPKAQHGFVNKILRVAPDALPHGAFRINAVHIDERPHFDFDPEALTVALPESEQDLKVKVELSAHPRILKNVRQIYNNPNI